MKYSVWTYRAFGLNLVIERIRQMGDTIRARLLARWWGMKLGKCVRFFGIPIMRRHPSGTVIIGDHAMFRSAETSNTVGINRRCVIEARQGAILRVGDHCGFSGTVLTAMESITIGDRVLCGANCTIIDSDRHPADSVARARKEKAKTAAIVIEDDVFLGMNVVVLKGCTIGKGTMVAANSILTKSLPSGVIAGGIPAKVLRKIDCKT